MPRIRAKNPPRNQIEAYILCGPLTCTRSTVHKHTQRTQPKIGIEGFEDSWSWLNIPGFSEWVFQQALAHTYKYIYIHKEIGR